MLGFARNLLLFGVSGASATEKSRFACATGAQVIALAWTCSRIARAPQLMVPGDFVSSLMTLCYCVLHVLRHFAHWNCCVQRMCSTVVCCHSILFCNSVSADRSGMAASRFLVVAAACVILVFRFPAESRESHCNGSVKRATGALAEDFVDFGSDDLLLKSL